mmetsp:Transcript_12992/g.37647  ORF Transcript_12992/g.37647 Transcript_12992/m.37647 type:complete len:272 (+) Transcript_12992:346-1161(+)
MSTLNAFVDDFLHPLSSLLGILRQQADACFQHGAVRHVIGTAKLVRTLLQLLVCLRGNIERLLATILVSGFGCATRNHGCEPEDVRRCRVTPLLVACDLPIEDGSCIPEGAGNVAPRPAVDGGIEEDGVKVPVQNALTMLLQEPAKDEFSLACRHFVCLLSESADDGAVGVRIGLHSTVAFVVIEVIHEAQNFDDAPGGLVRLGAHPRSQHRIEASRFGAELGGPSLSVKTFHGTQQLFGVDWRVFIGRVRPYLQHDVEAIGIGQCLLVLS